jgi:hypothetical protein
MAVVIKFLLMAWLVFEIVSLFLIIKTAFKYAVSKHNRNRSRATLDPFKQLTSGAKQ